MGPFVEAWPRHSTAANPASTCRKLFNPASGETPPPFSSPEAMRPLQQKLVDRLRNTASHTLAAFTKADASFLTKLCADWLGAWAKLEGFGSPLQAPGIRDAPTANDLSALLFGDERPSAT